MEIGTNTGVFATTESDAWALIPEEVSKEVISGVVEESAALSLLRKLPNMTSRTQRMPVLNALGAAYFTDGNIVSDDLTVGADQQIDDDRIAELRRTGKLPKGADIDMKRTHQMEWANVFIVAEPIAIILPVPEDVIEDANYPLWDEIRPRIVEAFGESIDSAILWGQNRPFTWPTGIVPTAINRGFVLQEGTSTVDIAEDISNLMGLLEAVGYDPTGFAADPSIKATLRNLRDSNGQPIFNQPLTAGTPATLYGQRLNYVKNASFLPFTARLIAGDFKQAVFSIRQDITWKLLDQSVITDPVTNEIVLNLAQQDMVALRAVMRLGWAVPNPIHRLGDRATRYPFAVLSAAAT